jgi:plasmid replication initiation protein
MQLIEIPHDKEIVQSNAITSGRFDYTACQLDILFMTLALLGKDDPPNKPYRIHISDIQAITGRKWDYMQLQEATKNMGCRMFEVTTAKSSKQFWLFQGVEYLTGQGCFDVIISEVARPYLFDLKENFTVMQLKTALSCSSKYAKRLYALACQWRVKGETPLIEINKLKEMLFLKDPKGEEKEQFTRINDFKKYVLDVAKEQINKHTDIRFDYVLKKQGRSFEKIKILVNVKMPEQLYLPLDYTQSLDHQKNVKAIQAYGFSEDEAKKLAKFSMDAFNKAVEQTKKQMAKKPVNNPGSYIRTILKSQKLI